MRNFFEQKNKGFTLIETLVAISIFTLSVLIMLVVLGGGIADANHAKNKLIASYLAQEGIELMRSLRDTHVLYGGVGGAGWAQFNSDIANCKAGASAGSNSGCYLDDQDSTPIPPITNIEAYNCATSPSGLPCQEFYYNEASGYSYVQSIGSVNSGFARVIRVENVGSSDREIKVTSTVFWSRGTNNHQVSFSENLFKWMRSIQ